MNLKNTWKAGIYIRLSKADEEKNESESITNQRNFIISYLQENGYELYDEYVDDGLSGTSFDRPAFNRMIEDIENKKINMVITKDSSRLGRNNEEFIGYTERYFPEHNVRYISILDSIDTYLDSVGNEMIQIKGMMNEWYSKDISKKIKASVETKKKQGLFLGGYTPYGYNHDPLNKYKLIIDENVADNVRLIYEMFINGNSLGKIAKHLTSKKIPTPSVYKNMNFNKDRKTRNLWDERTIDDILKNPTYIGNLAQNRRRKVNYKSKKIIANPKDKWIIAENTHEPIIDKAIFFAIQERMQQQTRSCKNGVLHPFVRRLYCDCCGKVLMKCGKKNINNFSYFCCKDKVVKWANCDNDKYLKEEELTEFVLDKINELLKRFYSQDSLNELKDDLIEQDLFKDKIKALEKELDSIEKELENKSSYFPRLYEDRLNGILPEKEFLVLMNKYKSDIEKFETRKKLIAKEITLINKQKETLKSKNNILEKYKHIDKLNVEFVGDFIDKILVGKYDEESNTREINIIWNFTI